MEVEPWRLDSLILLVRAEMLCRDGDLPQAALFPGDAAASPTEENKYRRVGKKGGGGVSNKQKHVTEPALLEE